MKNSAKYLIVLFLLIGISIGVYFYANRDNSPQETQFAIAPIEEVYTIEMSSKNGHKMTLNRIGDEWHVNNNYPAEKYKIKGFFELLSKLQVESNVSAKTRQSVIKELATNSIKVSAFDQDHKEIKSFYAGGDAASLGTYMILEHQGQIAANPYIVSIPGYRGQFIYNFSLDSIKWRSTQVFGTKYEDLTSIEVNYTHHPNQSFRMDIDEDEIVVKPLIDSAEIKSPVDQESVIRFLTEMESKNFEYYAENDSLKPTILSGKPFCTISTKNLNGAIRSLQMYEMPIHGRSYKVIDDKGAPLKIDEERFYGVISGRNDFVVGQYYVFGVLLKNYQSFFKKEKK